MGLLGEGGVGAVYRGRDADLGRDVAMKFLHPRYREHAQILHRFVEEAQIGGQLQHPGIVPVYELGMVDGSPFFAMKMVKGETLADKLAARSSPADRRGEFLAIFEQICQTMAYAHARGVVHRDLKPANVMIGSFGEVQVVDWGMGKVLQGGDAPRDEAESEADAPVSVIETVRSRGDSTRSIVGSVMGTPAYMPREQALGDVEAMDRRSDVFALGAILCEILTGLPPYLGSLNEMLSQAMRGKLDDAHERLAQCGADAELVALSTRCLQPHPDDRPESAAAVAEAVHAYVVETESRAHEATVKALALKRTQKYGVALTGVIAIGLAVSLWFWREADQQRDRAEESATAANDARALEQEAREDAEANLANFNRLSQFVRLDAAKQAAATMIPAWPEKLEALRDWQSQQAQPLEDALAGLKDTLAALEKRALAQSAEEVAQERASHPRAEELARLTAKLACWRRAAAVRTGAAEPPAFDLAGVELPDTAEAINELAWPLIDPERRDFGREAEGLALARRALATLDAGAPGRSAILDTLAWACLANGLHAEALEHSQAALDGAPAAQRAQFQSMRELLGRTEWEFSEASFAAVIDSLASQVEALREEVEQRSTWAFTADTDEFLHGALAELAAGIEAFEAQEVEDVARRVRWAERVEELTITRHAGRWREAREAIARADGVTASELYARVPIDLTPQMGLIPLGMNPQSKLWEFYHLRSAWDAATQPDPGAIEVPSYADGAELDRNGRGIVFVLLPGGSFLMGGQDQDPAAPNYCAYVEPEEMPVHEVSLAPFLLAKYELTQGQWARLSDGEWPSWYIVGTTYNGIPVEIQDSHPVEQVDWMMCTELMREHALALPTESQWEYGCRAGTGWPWSSGPEAASLERVANLLDHTGSTVDPPWGQGEPWDDHFKGPAPVGTYEPNPFGLYDMHGNLSEWCRDWFGRYSNPARAGDGLREPEFYEIIRTSRGGDYLDRAHVSRCSFRAYRAPNAKAQAIGMRAARPLLP
ncbi:MAG: SUMF1/EgtB/PvdO family nonheme iron enzyme [Planctomycetes bacterium]|nr:SUMF1/EgtB/PvdO family nonheme iron enzyme [Planctomycetota bacterium]